MQVQCLPYMIKRGLTPASRYRKQPVFGTQMTQERKRPDKVSVLLVGKQDNLSGNA